MTSILAPALPSLSDIKHMRHAISLANRVVGASSPNPPVGCVLVKDGCVLSAAHTAVNGRPHAEAVALSEAIADVSGATAYLTLEPCSHYGQTPPCAEALVKSGIKRVVIACIDPFPAVNGQGIKILQAAGIEVLVGVCELEAQKLYEGFFSVQNKKRPFITLKTATSLDGKIALKDGSSKWITRNEARNYVHLMRARCDAVITGIATIMADDPMFTCRLPGMEERSPIRVVLDTKLSLPESSKLVATAKTVPCWVVTLSETIINNPEKASQLEQHGIRLLAVNKAGNGKICLEDTMFKLAQNGIHTAIIEAGSVINTAVLQLGLVDSVAWFIAPIIIGNDGVAVFKDMHLDNLLEAHSFTLDSYETFGGDIKLQYFRKTGIAG